MRRQDAIVSDLRKWCNSDVCTAEIAMVATRGGARGNRSQHAVLTKGRVGASGDYTQPSECLLPFRDGSVSM